MSIFASRTQQTVELPFDAPHTITIRKLTGLEVERAQGEHLKGLVSGSRSARGWAEAFQRQLAKGVEDAAPILADPLNGFDRNTVIECGLVGWSYTDPKFGAKAVADLDDEASEFIAREILRLTRPSLFQTPEEQEIERKNAWSGSISV